MQVPDPGLLVDGDADGLLVVAEETLEGGGELLLLLSSVLAIRIGDRRYRGYQRARAGASLLGALGLAR